MMRRGRSASRLFAGGLIALALLAGAAPLAQARAAPSQTARNRAIIADFAHRFYDLRDVRGAFERYVAKDYVQHNPDIADGRDAAIAALEPLFSQPGSRFVVKRILVDGDQAVIHLHGRTGASGDVASGNGGAVADFYRLKNGRIVEHWDVLQPIASKTANPHPYF
ncbi:nuclear transport factor 2 family protein [Novosphingobium sp. FKTRR1]|uniref:nuclear transport factor 2 family protein n=1 Tax=Novosphingobium sp. FKTRR1 TaxID=2879118 RepID=UPI001CF09D2D|nr:nuclear transport factor 2 family protein [Novosphingobium sp. FKTRR1]